MTRLRLTAPQLADIQKCAIDFPYWCGKYMNVYVPQGQNHTTIAPMRLHPYQERYYAHAEDHRFTVLSKFRCGGFTTLALAYGLWRCLFRLDQNILFLARTDRCAVEANAVVRRALEYVPDWMTGNVLKMNSDHEKSFPETGSRISFHAPQAACGRAATLLVVDEAALIPDMEQHWKALYPTVSIGGSVIVQSTPNRDDDWFYDTLLDAKAGLNEFKVYACDYTEHPDMNTPEWVAQMKQQLGPVGWRAEVEQIPPPPGVQPVEKPAPGPTRKSVWRSVYDDDWSPSS